jgi:copper chaperone CopZ
METIELTITGMNCGACQAHVTQALEGAQGVQSVEVDLADARAKVQGERLDRSVLIAAVQEEGYGAQVKE